MLLSVGYIAQRTLRPGIIAAALDIGTPLIELLASSTSLRTLGGTVDRWLDTSGNNNHAINDTDPMDENEQRGFHNITADIYGDQTFFTEALTVDDVNDIYYIDNNAQLNAVNDELTIFMAVKGVPGANFLTSFFRKWSGNGVGWYIQNDSAGKITFVLRDAANVGTVIPPNANDRLLVFDDNFHTFALTLNNGNWAIYLDGEQTKTGTYTHGAGFGNTQDLNMFNRLGGDIYASYLYDTARTADQIADLHKHTLRSITNKETDMRTLYAPPILNPITPEREYTVERIDETEIGITETGVGTTAFDATQDMKINVTNTVNGIFNFVNDDGEDFCSFAGLRIENFKNVRLIGGAIKGTHAATLGTGSGDDIRGLLRIVGTGQSVHVEGLDVNCDRQDGLDAIIFGSFGNQVTRPDIQIQNCKIYNTFNVQPGDPDYEGLHADGLQFYGGCNNLRVFNVDIECEGQGVFLSPQVHNVGCVELQNMTIRGPESYTWMFYIRDPNEDKRPTFIFNEVYVSERNDPNNVGQKLNWELNSLFPREGLVNANGDNIGAVRKGDFVTWDAFPEIKGGVKLLKDTDTRTFCPSDAGANYTPKPYIGVATEYAPELNP